MKALKSHKTFEGLTQFWSHDSTQTKTEMKFSTFIPHGTVKGCLIWLSGLTCTEENFISKAGAQNYLAKAGLMVIAPDTSPRGLNLPGEHDAYDFGSGAGFYVDATTDAYKDHYRMYSYINEELYSLIQNKFEQKKIGVFGHSMGGHGALVLALRNPGKYASVSAFSPITHPSVVPWGEKAFKGYLGEDRATWNDYDAVELLKAGKKHPATILVSQGTGDEFLEKQLKPEDLREAFKSASQKGEVKLCEGYDHSYYFMASFMEDHIKHHSTSF
jgi:S-formylglutathione hydrolase